MRTIKTNMAFVLISCLVSFGLAELVTRLLYPPPQILNIRNTLEAASPQQTSPKMVLSVPNLPDQGLYLETTAGRRLRPNLEGLIENHAVSHQRIAIRTNALGYRNREIQAKSGPRILFLGDSITLGDYLSEEDTFVRQVESYARQQHQKNWETINAGVGAIGLKTELSIFLESGILTKPDIVVLDWYLNDFQESLAFYNPLPNVLRHSRFLSYLAIAITEGLSRMKNQSADLQKIESWKQDFQKRVLVEKGDFRTSQPALNAGIIRYFADWGGSWSPQAWECMSPLLAEFKRLAKTQKFTFCIVMCPVRYQVETQYLDDFPQQQLRKIANALDIPVLDLLPILRTEYSRGNRDLFYDRCHPNPPTNKIIAQAIYPFLEDLIQER